MNWDVHSWFLSVLCEDCPGLGHEPGIQCRFLCLLSNSYIVCWVSSCLEIQSGGLSTLFFFFCSSYLPYVSEEDSAIAVQLLPPPLFSHKGSSWCQLELGDRVDLKLVKIKLQGIEVWRNLSVSRCQTQANACCLSNH